MLKLIIYCKSITNSKSFIGSEWTSYYKPVKTIEIIESFDDFDEDKYTIKYMSLYGIDNVRGGSFCDLNLNDTYISILSKMIKSQKWQINNMHECLKSDMNSEGCEKKYIFSQLNR